METDTRAASETSATIDVPRARRVILGEIAVAMAVAALLWFAVDRGLHPLAGMGDPTARAFFAIKCASLAVLFSLVTGIEAVAHERLVSPAIDPLTGYETRRMRINQRYLQNTLEQVVVFIPGLIGLAYYCPDGRAMRAVVATTVVWILARAAFWIGYHRGGLHRAVGAPGMALGMVMLIYVSVRFGADLAGTPGAVIVGAGFLAIETVLLWVTRTAQPEAP